jgi:hypothetical protein
VSNGGRIPTTTPSGWDSVSSQTVCDGLQRVSPVTFSGNALADCGWQNWLHTCALALNVEEWRQAARLAGRRLGLRVRAEVRYGYVHVIDLPLPEWVRERAQRSIDDRARSLVGPAKRDG